MLFRKRDDKADLRDIKEVMEEPVEEVPTQPSPQRQPAAQQDLGAPLFVKVEKYREVLTALQEVKLFMSGVKHLFGIMHEIETVRSDAMNITRATIDRMEKAVVEIDSELLRPRGITLTDYDRTSLDITHVEQSLNDLQSQLGELRRELQGLR